MHTPRISLFVPLLAGPLVWAVHFVFIYAANGVFCARPALYGLWVDAALSVWAMGAAAVLAIAAIALIYWRQQARWPQTDEPGFFRWVAGALSLLAVIAIIWQTLPVLLVPACPAG
ncbi:hypothetical protein [Bordetella sp. BOR01]|uniref:hypothetical protein n=1 Tax=Bordetella sp. BOR01 TaxID=2854779 RepID=UPI001C49405E|nr:hypothetical protein [Bordetella sp. BOR01]MBV7486861.1 hypothetical protein [Bordetella sp. BOR01]